jgi:signal transduction histidine kinase
MTSHEFRTPLSTIFSSAELLEYYSDRWSEEKKRELLQRIQIAVKHMTRMLDDILVIGKAESGKLEFNPKSLNLNKFCLTLVEEAEVDDPDKHIINFVDQRESNEAVWLDEKLLKHIINNLLSNALKYSPKGSTIQFEISCQLDKIVFQFKDEGIGIPLEDQKRLFELFYRAKNVGTIQGTGLGLSIVKRSVDLHDGTIEIASEVGAGTTVTVTLPRKIGIRNPSYIG